MMAWRNKMSHAVFVQRVKYVYKWSVPKCTSNERAAWSSKLDNHDCVTTAPRKHGSDGYFATWLQRKLGNWLSYVVCDQSLHRLQGWPESSDQWSRTDTDDAPHDARCRRRMKPGNPVSRLLDREQVRHRCRIHDPSLGVLRILISTGPTVSRCRRCYSFSSREIDQFSRWISSVIQPFSANSKI